MRPLLSLACKYECANNDVCCNLLEVVNYYVKVYYKLLKIKRGVCYDVVCIVLSRGSVTGGTRGTRPPQHFSQRGLSPSTFDRLVFFKHHSHASFK